MQLAVQLGNLSAGYRERAVLKNISLQIKTGERVAFLGPNGAGKSTLLRTITGLLSPTCGSVKIFSHDLAKLTARERARLAAVVPQELDVAMPFMVEDLVSMGRSATLDRWQRLSLDDHAMIEQAMRYTNTINLRDRLFHEMSGGEKQRVAIAMALAANPKLMLLDEPTSHLDMNHRLEIALLIRRLNIEHGVTVMMAGHDLNLAAEFFPRIILLSAGQIAADGTPEEVLRPEILREVYGCHVSVQPDSETGFLRVFPKPDSD